MLSRILTDARLAWRATRSNALQFWLSVTTVVLVAGAGSALFAVVNATMLRPLPFEQPEQLARIHLFPPGVSSLDLANPLHPLDFVRLRERLSLADGPEGLFPTDVAIGGDVDPESVPAATVSAGLFQLLGARPLLGRTFTDDEDRDRAGVVVLSHGLWQRRFAADPGVIGQPLIVDGRTHVVIGVMARDFEPAYVKSDLWIPLGIHRGNLPRAGATYIQNVIRLHDGVSLEEIREEVRAVLADVERESPETLKDWASGVRSLREAHFGSTRSTVVLLLIAVGALALIATVNLAHLTFARAASRRGETALRVALGASAGDLARLALVDAGLVAVLGVAGGTVMGRWLLSAMLSLHPESDIPLSALSLDWRVVGLTAAVGLLTTLTASLLPLSRGFRSRTGRALVGASPRTAGPSHRGLGFSLVAAETALAVVLLVSAFLVLVAFGRVSRIDPGYRSDSILAAQLRLLQDRYATPEQRVALLDGVLDAVRVLPGVVSAGSTMNLFDPGFAYVTIVYNGDPPPPDAPGLTVQFRRVSDGYFETMGIRLHQGRLFTRADAAGSEPVAIISRRLADQFWPRESPLGRRFRRGATSLPLLTVVGVVDDVRDVSLAQEAQAALYLPYRQDNTASAPIGLVVRVEGDAASATPEVAAAVRRVDPGQPLSRVTTVETFLSDSLGGHRFQGSVLGSMAVLGLLLAIVGIYGVTARSVVERSREVGVRLALGGSLASVWMSVAARSIGAVCAGTALGCVLAFAAGSLLRAHVPEAAEVGVLTGWPVVPVLMASGALAAILPSRRVTRIDPAVTLRAGG